MGCYGAVFSHSSQAQRPAPQVPRLRDPGVLLCLLAVVLVHFALVTRGTGDLFGPELLGNVYDSLAQNLLAGSATVHPKAIRWEAFHVEDRSYTYFGPWPALLRMAPNALAPSLLGQWSRASCLAAALLAVCGFGLLAARALAANPRLGLPAKRTLPA